MYFDQVMTLYTIKELQNSADITKWSGTRYISCTQGCKRIEFCNILENGYNIKEQNDKFKCLVTHSLAEILFNRCWYIYYDGLFLPIHIVKKLDLELVLSTFMYITFHSCLDWTNSHCIILTTRVWLRLDLNTQSSCSFRHTYIMIKTLNIRCMWSSPSKWRWRLIP